MIDIMKSTDLERKDVMLIRTEASQFSLGSKQFKITTQTPPSASVHTNVLSNSMKHKTMSDASKSADFESGSKVKLDASSLESE